MPTNFFNSLLKHARSGARLDPVRDWLVLLIVSTITLAGIIVWNVWAFDTVASGGTIGAPATRAPAVFGRTSLEAIRAIFEKRAAEEAKYRTGVYGFTDPSQ
jgi:hypothetical protein